MSDAPASLTEQRYQGRPLLRLLDSYVLAITGNLAPELEARVAEIVQRTFGGNSDWKTTLRETVKLPPDMEDRIQALWGMQPVGTDPLIFSLAVSDDNFLALIDPE